VDYVASVPVNHLLQIYDQHGPGGRCWNACHRAVRCDGVAARRSAALASTLLLAAAFALAPSPAHAATTTIDGISDQSLPAWDGGFADSYFAGLFRADWVGEGSIRYARYVVQWNVMSPARAPERATFEAWLDDVASLGLTADVALTSFDGVRPSSPDEYAAALAAILGRARVDGHPLPYVEAWNEPNNQGAESAPVAARLTDAAHALCAAGYGCAVIAGDFEDSPNLARYERAYERALDFPPGIWGVHPYRSVEELNAAPYLGFLRGLPRGGAGAQVWITEIAARRCTDYGGVLREYGEAGQARRARWLVQDLLRRYPPARAFYYELLLDDDRRPSCADEAEDGALYEPGAPPSVQDAPRVAACFIWSASGLLPADGETTLVGDSFWMEGGALGSS
jgi:hypothetical protein